MTSTVASKEALIAALAQPFTRYADEVFLNPGLIASWCNWARRRSTYDERRETPGFKVWLYSNLYPDHVRPVEHTQLVADLIVMLYRAENAQTEHERAVSLRELEFVQLVLDSGDVNHAELQTSNEEIAGLRASLEGSAPRSDQNASPTKPVLPNIQAEFIDRSRGHLHFTFSTIKGAKHVTVRDLMFWGLAMTVVEISPLDWLEIQRTLVLEGIEIDNWNRLLLTIESSLWAQRLKVS